MRLPVYILLLTLIFSVEGTNLVYAQNSNLEKANRYYSHKEYSLAIKYLKKDLDNRDDFQTKVKLAQCYKLTHQNEKAEQLYSKIVEDPQAMPSHFLDYAQLLKQSHKYSKAKQWFEKYANYYPRDKQISNLINSCNLINELHDDSLYVVEPININTPQSDFASAFYRKGIVLLSGRPNKTSQAISSDNEEHYLDLYYSQKKGDKYIEPIPFADIFNSRYHEGPVCFSKNQRFIYFTRNKRSINLEGKSELSIYSAHFNGTYWDKPELFQFTGFSYSIGHPSLSPDGRRLYFISNMTGGYGGTDIYVCHKQGFSWSRPINLGPQINTSQNEMFPFFAEDGYLYFASEGHIGFGGLDIFKSHFDQNQWSHPLNMGPPFNSPKDDFAFFVDTNKENGYFSSNREGGKGSDDIYQFTRNTKRMTPLTGRIIQTGTKEPLERVEVTLKSTYSKEGVKYTDQQGVFNFNIIPNKNYSFIIRKPGHKTKRILYFAKSRKKPTSRINIMMDTTRWEKLQGKVMDEFSARHLQGATIQLINKIYSVNNVEQSNEDGNFSFDIDPGKPYDMIITKKGYYTQVINNFRYNKGNDSKIEMQRISRNQHFELTDVEYELGKWELLDKTKTELDNITRMLHNNPNIIISIGAYTHQDKGRKANQKLCSMRAQTASNYIISKGIAPNRIETKPLGFHSGHSILVVKVTETY